MSFLSGFAGVLPAQGGSCNGTVPLCVHTSRRHLRQIVRQMRRETSDAQRKFERQIYCMDPSRMDHTITSDQRF